MDGRDTRSVLAPRTAVGTVAVQSSQCTKNSAARRAKRACACKPAERALRGVGNIAAAGVESGSLTDAPTVAQLASYTSYATSGDYELQTSGPAMRPSDLSIGPLTPPRRRRVADSASRTTSIESTADKAPPPAPIAGGFHFQCMSCR